MRDQTRDVHGNEIPDGNGTNNLINHWSGNGNGNHVDGNGKENRAVLPKLYSIACQILCIPSSSGASERVFSTSTTRHSSYILPSDIDYGNGNGREWECCAKFRTGGRMGTGMSLSEW